jgi:hypothetical protein
MKEKMPEEWSIAVIRPIHKKGSKMDCDNYRGIAFLSVVYKVMSALIANRQVRYTEKVIGEYQCGVRQNRSNFGSYFQSEVIPRKMLRI